MTRPRSPRLSLDRKRLAAGCHGSRQQEHRARGYGIRPAIGIPHRADPTGSAHIPLASNQVCSAPWMRAPHTSGSVPNSRRHRPAFSIPCSRAIGSSGCLSACSCSKMNSSLSATNVGTVLSQGLFILRFRQGTAAIARQKKKMGEERASVEARFQCRTALRAWARVWFTLSKRV